MIGYFFNDFFLSIVHFVVLVFAGAQSGWDPSALQFGVWRRSSQWCYFCGSISGCSIVQLWQIFTLGGSTNWLQFFVFILLELHPWNCSKLLLLTSSTLSCWRGFCFQGLMNIIHVYSKKYYEVWQGLENILWLSKWKGSQWLIVRYNG